MKLKLQTKRMEKKEKKYLWLENKNTFWETQYIYFGWFASFFLSCSILQFQMVPLQQTQSSLTFKLSQSLITSQNKVLLHILIYLKQLNVLQATESIQWKGIQSICWKKVAYNKNVGLGNTLCITLLTHRHSDRPLLEPCLLYWRFLHQ